jgi:hypothetical protein
MVREPRSNRKGVRARLDWAVFQYVKFEPPTEEHWRELQEALGEPIPQRARELQAISNRRSQAKLGRRDRH